MRITQLSEALHPLLLALLALQLISISSSTAMPTQLHQERSNDDSNRMDDMDDGVGSGCTNSGDNINSSKCEDKSGMMPPCNARQTATNIAQKAATEAEQAYGTQQAAAAEVARMVKKQLADRAYAAAKAAEAALSGKQQNVEQLEQEISEAEAALQQQAESITGTQDNLNIASMTVKDAQQLSQSLKKAINLAQENLAHAKAVAAGAQHELESKSQLLEQSQCRIDGLKKRLCEARREMQNIKKSAYKAVCAAAEACKKARDRRTVTEKGRIKRRIQQQIQQRQQSHNSGVLW
ncbi:tropomyosin alpha-3 chain [Drosophila grimshawi]|uniref:GH14746 n=1 Tax=Drosophila grimshawi TaxID=7222 RepID=B4JT34_DROGR|nr:tropomyosin alpha-3 chain [Drosophila grimshawi]EDV94924.1 GH14746 [Drosophila grimshawi]